MRLHEGDAAALARLGDHELRALFVFERRECVSEGREVVSVALGDRPAEGRHLRAQISEIAHLLDPRVRLHLVAVDDHGDLVQPAVGGRLQRLPELPLLELAVAGEHVDAAGAAEHAIGEHEPARLRDAHPERAGARHDLGRRRHVRMPGQAVQPPQLVDQVEVEPPERREHGVQAGHVVALGREVAVAVAEHLEMEPGDDVERAERRAGMAGAGPLDHVERVQPARVGERRRALLAVAVERTDALELRVRDVAQRHATGSSIGGNCAAPARTIASARATSSG